VRSCGVLLSARGSTRFSAVIQPPHLGCASGRPLCSWEREHRTRPSFLKWQDLEFCFWERSCAFAPQRELFKVGRTPTPTVEALFRFNAQGLSASSDLYFDPQPSTTPGSRTCSKGGVPAFVATDKARTAILSTDRAEPITSRRPTTSEIWANAFSRPGPLPKVHRWPAER